MPDQQSAFSDAELAGRLRSKYPGVYDQVPDQQLAAGVRTNRPDLVAELMAAPKPSTKGTGPALPPTPMSGVEAGVRAIGKKALLPFEPTFNEGPRLAAASALTGSEQKPLANATYGEALKSIADSHRSYTGPSYSYDPRTGKKTYGVDPEEVSQAQLKGLVGGSAEGAMALSPLDLLSLAALSGGPGAVERLGSLWKGLDVGDPLLARAINALGTVMPRTAGAIRSGSGVEERLKIAADAAKKLGKAGTADATVAASKTAAPAAAAPEVPAPASTTPVGAPSSPPFEAQATKLPRPPLKSTSGPSEPPVSGTKAGRFSEGDQSAKELEELLDRTRGTDRGPQIPGHAGNGGTTTATTPAEALQKARAAAEASNPRLKVKLSAQELLEKSRELTGSTPRADAAFKTTTDTAAGNKAFSTQVKDVAADIGGKGGPRPLRVAASDAINPKLTPAEQYAGIQRVAEYAKQNPWLRPADLVSGQESRKRLLKALADYAAKGQ